MSDWPVQRLWNRRTTADIIYIIYIELDGYVGLPPRRGVMRTMAQGSPCSLRPHFKRPQRSVLRYYVTTRSASNSKHWFTTCFVQTLPFCQLYVFTHFSVSFCTAHCALDFARDHVP